MTNAEQRTRMGTRHERSNLVPFRWQTLRWRTRHDGYVDDAWAAGDAELAQLFQELQEDRQRIDRARNYRAAASRK